VQQAKSESNERVARTVSEDRGHWVSSEGSEQVAREASKQAAGIREAGQDAGSTEQSE
jgi:hypothetical protein